MTHKIERRPHLAHSYLPHSRLQGLGLYRRNRTKSCHPWRKKSSSSWRMGFYQIGAGSIQIYHLKGEELQLKLKMPVDGSTKIQVISRNFSCFFLIFEARDNLPIRLFPLLFRGSQTCRDSPNRFTKQHLLFIQGNKSNKQ